MLCIYVMYELAQLNKITEQLESELAGYLQVEVRNLDQDLQGLEDWKLLIKIREKNLLNQAMVSKENTLSLCVEGLLREKVT